MKEILTIVLVVVVVLAVTTAFYLSSPQKSEVPLEVKDEVSAEKVSSDIKSTLVDAKKDLADIRDGLPI